MKFISPKAAVNHHPVDHPISSCPSNDNKKFRPFTGIQLHLFFQVILSMSFAYLLLGKIFHIEERSSEPIDHLSKVAIPVVIIRQHNDLFPFHLNAALAVRLNFFVS
jgi:hypothetical protein